MALEVGIHAGKRAFHVLSLGDWHDATRNEARSKEAPRGPRVKPCGK
jgi:hypothetical protein